LLKLVHQSVGKMLYAENCYVALYDKATDILSVPFCIDKYDAVASSAKLGKGLTAYVLRQGRPTLITTDGIRALTRSGEVDIVGTLPAIWLGVPLRTREGVIGVLVVQHYENADTYDQRDVRFLSSVGDQIAIAIERKQAEERLQQSEERFKDLFDNAPIAYHELDIDGRYTRINHTEELLLGYTNEELTGRHVSELILEKTSRRTVAATLAGTQHLSAVERTFTRKDGTLVSVLNEDTMIYDADGRITGIRSTLQDITARKKAEEQLRIFNEKLQQSNRELQDFAYVASHDLQEPLRKVQAFSDRLKTKYGDRLEGDGLDYLERMRSAANRMQLLIQDLLTFSRVSTQARPFAKVDLNAITREVLSDLEVKIEETGSTIVIDELPRLDADPTQMRQLMQNLVGNALKFRQMDTPPVINIYSKAVKANGNGLGKSYQVFVKDNGIGFDEKYTDKIFAVFQRLHGRAEYEGSGVGLAICRKIVERHNGNITAQSRPGEGATFAFTIPLKQSPTDIN
jgi:two-component system, LuxR family, sensor kinase FixL